MENYLTPAEAIKALNNNKVLKSETSDGYILMQKKSKTIYETKVFTNEEEQPVIINGNIANVMKTLNRTKINNKFFIVN